MKLGLQLFTLREQTTTAEGLRSVLRRARELGYEGVQLSAVGCMNGDSPEVSAKNARAMLDELGLACCATHRPWERFESQLEDEIAFHQALGCPHAAIGVPPGWAREEGRSGWSRLAWALESLDRSFRPHGIRMGYHNHALEFERFAPSSSKRRDDVEDPGPVGKEGFGGGDKRAHPFDLLIEQTPGIHFILDTYWVVHAGIELVPLIERLAGRLPVVHLKDRAVFGWEVDFAPVGEGNLDWDRILAAFRASGTEWVVVEQDTCRRDVWDCVASSARFLRDRLE